MTKRLFDHNVWPSDAYACNALEYGILKEGADWVFPCTEGTGTFAYDPRLPGNADLKLRRVSGTDWFDPENQSIVEGSWVDACSGPNCLHSDGIAEYSRYVADPTDAFGNLNDFYESCILGGWFIVPDNASAYGSLFSIGVQTTPTNTAPSMDFRLHTRTKLAFEGIPSGGDEVRHYSPNLDLELGSGSELLPTHIAFAFARTDSTIVLDAYINGLLVWSLSSNYNKSDEVDLLSNNASWQSFAEAINGRTHDSTNMNVCHSSVGSTFGEAYYGYIYGFPTNLNAADKIYAIQQHWNRNFSTYAVA